MRVLEVSINNSPELANGAGTSTMLVSPSLRDCSNCFISLSYISVDYILRIYFDNLKNVYFLYQSQRVRDLLAIYIFAIPNELGWIASDNS